MSVSRCRPSFFRVSQPPVDLLDAAFGRDLREAGTGLTGGADGKRGGLEQSCHAVCQGPDTSGAGAGFENLARDSPNVFEIQGAALVGGFGYDWL